MDYGGLLLFEKGCPKYYLNLLEIESTLLQALKQTNLSLQNAILQLLKNNGYTSLEYPKNRAIFNGPSKIEAFDLQEIRIAESTL